MRLPWRHPVLLALGGALLLNPIAACGKGPETSSAPSTPSPAHAPDAAAAPSAPTEPGPAATPTPAPTENEILVLAKLRDREVRSPEVEARLAELVKAGQELDYQTVRETVEDLVDDALLAAEAKAANFTAPSGTAPGDEALAEAWAKDKLLPEAKAQIGDAQLAAWFAERRGVARISLRSAEQARDVHKSLLDSVANAPEKKREVFLEVKGKLGLPAEVVPDGALVDAEGKSELGEALVPTEVAKALFALTEDGAIAEPVAVGEAFVIVQRVGLRPGTPLDKVPADQKQLALDKLIAARAMDLTEEHVARLRKEQGADIDEGQVKKLALRLGVHKVSKLRKMPFSVRKLQLQRLRGAAETRSPALVPSGARAVEKATYDKVKDKMNAPAPKDQSPAGGTP